jgi:hypothetical protein
MRVVEGAEIHEDGRAGRAVEVPAWGAVEAPEAEVSQQSRRPERWVGDHGSPQGAIGAHRQHRSALEVELGQPVVEGASASTSRRTDQHGQHPWRDRLLRQLGLPQQRAEAAGQSQQ